MRSVVLLIAGLVLAFGPVTSGRAQPGLVSATLLGGSGDDFIEELVLAADGDVLLCGWTHSPDLAAGTPPAGGNDAFVARCDPVGATRWLVRLGGSGNDQAFGLAEAGDGSGDVLVAGYASPDLPATPGAYAAGTGGGFVARLSGLDGTLLWLTHLPGGRVRTLDVAPDGDVLVAGAAAPILPASAGAFETVFNGGANDAFAARLSPDGASLRWATFVGGSGDAFLTGSVVEAAFDGQALPDGSYVIAGATDSTDFPVTAGAAQPVYGGGSGDGFVARVASDGASLLWASFLGGDDNDHFWRVVVDDDLSVVAGGQAGSSDYPTTAGAFDTTLNDSAGAVSHGDACLTRLAADGATILWSTFVGGAANEHVHGLDLAPDGSLAVACSTESSDLPVTAGSVDDDKNDGEDCYLFALSADGSTLEYASYLGGLDRTTGHALTVAPDGSWLLAGPTRAPDFPVTPGGVGPHGAWDGWLARLHAEPTSGGFSTLGEGCANVLGLDQVLDGLGSPQPGATFWVSLRYLAPTGGLLALVFGTGTTSVQVKPGCQLHVAPLLPPVVFVPLAPSGPGGATLLFTVPVPVGTPTGSIGVQALIADASVPFGVSASPGLQVTIGP